MSTRDLRSGAILGRSTVAVALAIQLAGCGAEGDTLEKFGADGTVAIPPRAGSVVVDGCALDASQTATLQSPSARRVLREVVLRCPQILATGDVTPSDPAARAALAAQIASLKQLGYAVRLGVTFADNVGTPLPSADWEKNVVAALVALPAADGLEIDVAPRAFRSTLPQLIAALRAAVGPGAYLGIFVPGRAASDIFGDDAYDLAALSAQVAKVRLMTIDFSKGAPGPLLDSGWAVDQARAARPGARGASMDLVVPLFGNEFKAGAAVRRVGYEEALATARGLAAEPERTPTGTLHAAGTSAGGQLDELWFDDATSIARALHAWDGSTLPLDTGVCFYGLGAEDPSLFDTVAREMP